MDLVWPPLDNILHLDRLLPLLHSVLVLVLAWQHGEWDLHSRSIASINHGGMAGRGCLERCTLLRDQVHYLAAPAVAYDSPFGYAALGLDLLEHLRNAAKCLWRSGFVLEECTELLALLVGVWGIPGDVRWRALEEVCGNLLGHAGT